MSKEKLQTTYLFGQNFTFIEELYERYVNDPSSVDVSWKSFFDNLSEDKHNFLKSRNSAKWGRVKPQVVGAKDPEEMAKPKEVKAGFSEAQQAIIDSLRAAWFISDFRDKGHFLTDLDPLGLEKPKTLDELGLHPDNYGFEEKDYDRPIDIDGYIAGVSKASIREIFAILKQVYGNKCGVELAHIYSEDEKYWIYSKLEMARSSSLAKDEKVEALQNLVEVEGFEQFLHKKFPGAKRFSVEGGDNTINAAYYILKTAVSLGVEQAVLGMAHRGRLNMLTKIMGKSYVSMLSEFKGNLAHPEDLDVSGDVKYHLGLSNTIEFKDTGKLYVSLTANPSHLEAVNPVVAGRVRAKQYSIGDTDRNKVMGLLLHGDAAFIGQGVVAESLMHSEIDGYKTGGIVHIITNNQIGFTTDYHKGRSGRYPTEFAKIIGAPIFHVNGDEAEEVVKVAKIAMEYRQKFKKDVVIDLVCYRLYGHNEGDEPLFTQPIMYRAVSEKETPGAIYMKRLLSENVVSNDHFTVQKEKFNNFLEDQLKQAETYKPVKADWLENRWKGFNEDIDESKEKNTGFDVKKLKELGLKLCEYPAGFNINPKVAKQFETKKQMIETGAGIDWATAEGLAFASLLSEDVHVRLSGQDSGRGTFSHRHSVLVDQATQKLYKPLNNLGVNQAEYEVIDSNLSEYAVLGFEYGYSLNSPRNLVIWEAQFGDFANGAQIMIDQFIASGETKWLRLSGLVMLLPHGYEGQGPEHSSARLERFLQLCAEDNMRVLYPSTPASYFHALRRQIHSQTRKPLIVMSPKSLLRHKLAISTLDEMSEHSTFQKVIGDSVVSSAKRVVLCSGKIYYDLFEEREKSGIKDVALVRIEQLYPFPEKEITEILSKYKSAELVWCQEEPKNMGSWRYIYPEFMNLIEKNSIPMTKVSYVGRKETASTAAGYLKVHNKEQKEIVELALKK